MRSCEAVSLSVVCCLAPDTYLLETLVFGISLIRRKFVVAQLLYGPPLERIVGLHYDTAARILVDTKGGIMSSSDRLSCVKSVS